MSDTIKPRAKRASSRKGSERTTRAAIRKDVEVRQSAFLQSYGDVGTIRKACLLTEIARGTVEGWMRKDICGFKLKMSTARELFRELIQDTIWERVKQQKPGENPVLILALINAHWPEKYKRDAHGQTTEIQEMMAEWKRWAKDAKRGDSAVPTSSATEEDQARRNAIDQVEKILSRRKGEEK